MLAWIRLYTVRRLVQMLLQDGKHSDNNNVGYCITVVFDVVRLDVKLSEEVAKGWERIASDFTLLGNHLAVQRCNSGIHP